MSSTRLLALCALLLTSFVGVAADDEIVKEFKKYFRKYKDTPTRVEAILALEGTEGPGVVDVLIPILKDPDAEVVEACMRILGGFESEASSARLFEKLEKEKKEIVRIGLLRAIAKGGYSGGDEVLQECLEDRAWTVRWRTIQVLGASGDQAHAAAILPYCADDEPGVRGAALEALADLRSPLVHDAAHTALIDDSWQVRSTAIDALGRVRKTASVDWLVERMAQEEGRLLEDIGHALENLTGRSFGTRTELWVRFRQNADDYEIPSDEQIAKLRAARAKREKEYTPNGVTYHGIDTPSRSILFVIDVSGSMENEVIERERFEDGDFPSFQRIDIVKTELARTIEGLESYVKFNILAFASKVDPWKKELVTANVLNKSSAMSWTNRLEPLGGESKMALGNVGLVGTADLSAGKTNTHGALAWALGIEGEGKRRGDYEIDVDTIFFLSDGRPTTGAFIDPQDILREINEANALRKVVIHTIALGEFQKNFMRLLAEDNGGVFVDLGR
ncbi:MAG: HEAT repeat protein [Chlamydiales bacterium]|jgi:HEAT repeat protein